MAPTPRFHPNLNSSKLFNSSKYSDLLIKFSGREIKAHRFVLCEQSEYFDKLCGLESQFFEAKESQVTLHDDDPDAVEAVIRHLYNFELDPPPSSDKLSFYCNVVVAADKYSEFELSIKASRDLEAHLDDMEPDDLFAALKTVTEKCGDYDAAMSVVKDQTVSNLKELTTVVGFSAWLVSQPPIFNSIIGIATLWLSLEVQERYKRTVYCGGETVQPAGKEQPHHCGGPMAYVGKAWCEPGS